MIRHLIVGSDMDFSEVVLKFSNLIDALSGFLYTYILIFLLLACGLYFTIKTRFIQFRFLSDVFFVLKERGQKKHISPFGALMISTASRAGLGNIVGVGVAISVGGVGALFWRWVVEIVGGGGQVPL